MISLRAEQPQFPQLLIPERVQQNGCEDDKKALALLLWGKAEVAASVQLEEEKAQRRRLTCSLPFSQSSKA